MTLTEFLLARIAEDEAVARGASREGGDEPDTSEWWANEIPGPSMRKTLDEPTKTVIDSPGCLVTYEVCRAPFADHIARHDPARVLAECEAKRRIVSRCDMVLRGREVGMFNEGQDTDASDNLRALALPYADHPDYDERWRP